jgi:predicted anti-sigma-YlaC factor YlaD
MGALAAALSLALLPGCGIKRLAVNQLGDALAGGGTGTVFSGDDSPELIRAATPFSLKLMESLLAENPGHRKLLLATSQGFTQYAYAFVKQDADEIEDENIEKALAIRGDAKKLLLRARDYGLRAIEVDHRGFGEQLRKDPSKAVGTVGKKDIAKLYWTGAAWGAAISVAKDDAALIGDLPIVEALMGRVLALDEAFDHGAAHGFFISYEMAKPGDAAEAAKRARKHFDRAVELSGGLDASPYVTLAEAVAIPAEDKKQFEELLGKALEIDAGAKPELRLSNTVFQRRARWLLSRKDRLFL